MAKPTASKMLASFSVFFLSLFVEANTDCIGPSTAYDSIVYLHGMDTQEPSAQEKRNRAALENLSKKLNIRFALPRATMTCPDNKDLKCWTWAPKNALDLHAIEKSIYTAARKCFSSQSYSLLGFSNGGTVVNAISRLCMGDKFKALISVGAPGSWYLTDPKTLSNCIPKLTLMIGASDQVNQTPVRELYRHITELNGPVELIEYSGGHELPSEALEVTLKKLLKSR